MAGVTKKELEELVDLFGEKITEVLTARDGNKGMKSKVGIWRTKLLSAVEEGNISNDVLNKILEALVTNGKISENIALEVQKSGITKEVYEKASKEQTEEIKKSVGGDKLPGDKGILGYLRTTQGGIGKTLSAMKKAREEGGGTLGALGAGLKTGAKSLASWDNVLAGATLALSKFHPLGIIAGLAIKDFAGNVSRHNDEIDAYNEQLSKSTKELSRGKASGGTDARDPFTGLSLKGLATGGGQDKLISTLMKGNAIIDEGNEAASWRAKLASKEAEKDGDGKGGLFSNIKNLFSSKGGIGRMLLGVSKGLGGVVTKLGPVLGALGPGLAVAGAAMAGWKIGKWINDKWGGEIGSAIDRVSGWFGGGAAKKEAQTDRDLVKARKEYARFTALTMEEKLAEAQIRKEKRQENAKLSAMSSKDIKAYLIAKDKGSKLAETPAVVDNSNVIIATKGGGAPVREINQINDSVDDMGLTVFAKGFLI